MAIRPLLISTRTGSLTPEDTPTPTPALRGP